MASAALEQLASRAALGIEVTVPGKAILTQQCGCLGLTPVICFPRAVEGHALRVTLGSVHPRDIATIDQELAEGPTRQMAEAPEHNR